MTILEESTYKKCENFIAKMVTGQLQSTVPFPMLAFFILI